MRLKSALIAMTLAALPLVAAAHGIHSVQPDLAQKCSYGSGTVLFCTFDAVNGTLATNCPPGADCAFLTEPIHLPIGVNYSNLKWQCHGQGMSNFGTVDYMTVSTTQAYAYFLNKSGQTLYANTVITYSQSCLGT